MRRTRLQTADLVGLVLWVAAGLLLVVAAVVGPEGQCEVGNDDAWSADSRRAGLALLAAALALGGAAIALSAGAFARGPRSGKALRGGLALLSFVAACVTGVLALLALLAWGCLE